MSENITPQFLIKFMNKVDIFIVSIPEFDSPVIRDFIHRYYQRFNKIYYIFNYVKTMGLTESEKGYINFITDDLKDKCEIIHQEHECFDEHDWRSLSVKNVLERSNGDYIFSIEPDFFGDWEKIINMMINEDYDIFSNYTCSNDKTNVRLWPSFWGCKRSLLNSININFSAMPEPKHKVLYKIDYNKVLKFDENDKLIAFELNNTALYDHFDYVSTQLVEKSCDDGKKILLLNRFKDIWYGHSTGITHDFYSVNVHKKIFRMPDEYFKFYNICKKCEVKFYQPWIESSEQIISSKPS